MVGRGSCFDILGDLEGIQEETDSLESLKEKFWSVPFARLE